MNKQEFLILYQYNAWSNAKILDAASNITQEQFLASVSFPHGSLRGTLLHALFAEWIWRKRWEGTPNNPGWKLDEFPTLESLRVRWAEEETKLMNFVVNLTDERLYSTVKYVSTEGRVIPMRERFGSA